MLVIIKLIRIDVAWCSRFVVNPSRPPLVTLNYYLISVLCPLTANMVTVAVSVCYIMCYVVFSLTGDNYRYELLPLLL